jgi:pantothenate synthetase
MILEAVAYGVLLLIIVVLLINNLAIRSKNRRLSTDIIQIALDKSIISKKLKEELDKKDSESIEKSEGFLKFISQSRDWAFDYIEQVQAALLEFKNKIEPEILYAKTYGTVSGQSPHTIIIDRISDAYDELVKILPEDSSESNLRK